MLFAALLLALTQPQSAGTEVSATAEQVSSSAMALSRLLNPADKMAEVAARALDAGFDAAGKADRDHAELLGAHPGLEQAIRRAAHGVLAAHNPRLVAESQRYFGAFYQQKFSAAEIRTLLDFYSSPTGGKLVEGMYAGLDMDVMLDRMRAGDDDTLAAGDVAAINRSTVRRIMPAFSKADEEALATFAQTPAFKKLQRVTPEFQLVVAKFANAPDPVLDAAMDTAVQKVVEAYIEREEKARLN